MITDEIRLTACSIVENMAGHGKDHLGVTEIERETVNGRLYIYYEDNGVDIGTKLIFARNLKKPDGSA